jgi:hypothetical protein
VFDSSSNPKKSPLQYIKTSHLSNGNIRLTHNLNFTHEKSGNMMMVTDPIHPNQKNSRFNFSNTNLLSNISASDPGNCGTNETCKTLMTSKINVGNVLHQELQLAQGVDFSFFRGKRGLKELVIIRRWKVNPNTWKKNTDHHYRHVYHFWSKDEGMKPLCQ